MMEVESLLLSRMFLPSKLVSTLLLVLSLPPSQWVLQSSCSWVLRVGKSGGGVTTSSWSCRPAPWTAAWSATWKVFWCSACPPPAVSFARLVYGTSSHPTGSGFGLQSLPDPQSLWSPAMWWGWWWRRCCSAQLTSAWSPAYSTSAWLTPVAWSTPTWSTSSSPNFLGDLKLSPKIW